MTNKMKKPTRKEFEEGKYQSFLIGQPDDLVSTCYALNCEWPQVLRDEFRRLVKLWQESGPNLAKMFGADKTLAKRVSHGRTQLVPTSSGRAYLLWLPNLRGSTRFLWKDQALAHFLDLVVNFNWYKLGGPCPKCDTYYVKKRASQKIYCSAKCGAGITALVSTRKRRAKEHMDKLSRAKEAIQKWPKERTRLPWKRWVSNQTKLTVKWLSRAANKGELQEPVKNRNCP